MRTPSARSQTAGMLLPAVGLRSPTSPPLSAQVCNQGARLTGAAAGLRDETGGGARCGETGRSPSGGHPANRHSSRVHFKASRREPWRGRGGEVDGPPQCLLGDVVRARGTKPQRTQRELQVREHSARIPGRHAPKLGSSTPPPLQKLRWPPAEGRLQSQGRRWVRRGWGRGAQGQPVRGCGPTRVPVPP